MADYETPSWGKLPEDSADLFKLEVLKSGLIVQELELSGKDHFVLGRQPDIVDFCLEHSSISRKHAVLQYRDDNALMLINFGGMFITPSLSHSLTHSLIAHMLCILINIVPFTM
jgi:hypothetical protein